MGIIIIVFVILIIASLLYVGHQDVKNLENDVDSTINSDISQVDGVGVTITNTVNTDITNTKSTVSSDLNKLETEVKNTIGKL